MTKIIILCGVPCSGKSTYREKFLKNFPKFISFSTDDMIEEWASKNNTNYSEAFGFLTKKTDDETQPTLKKFEKEMFSNFEKALSENKSIIVDRTNMNVKSRKRFLDLVPKHYSKTAIVFQVPIEELNKRLKKREEETGKHIPEYVITSMLNSYEEPTLEEFDKIIFEEQ